MHSRQPVSGMYGIGKVKIKFVPKKKKSYIGGIIFFSGVIFLVFSAMWSYPGVRHGIIVPTLHQSLELFQSVRELALNRISNEKTDLNIDTEVLPRDENNNIIYRVSGTSVEELLRAQGYTHAKHRLFQMDVLGRRVAFGTASEVFGSDALHSDRTMRVFNLGGLVALEYAELLRDHEEQKKKQSLEQQKQQGDGDGEGEGGVSSASAYEHLLWYTKGVNQYIATHPALPLEHTLYGVHHPRNNSDTSSLAIKYWSVQDSLALVRLRLLFGADFLALQDELMRDVLEEVLHREPAVTEGADAAAEAESKQGSIFDELVGAATVTGCGTETECIPIVGSMAWLSARSGSYASDMYEKSVLPSKYMHMKLELTTGGDSSLMSMSVTGLSIPGVPFVVSNAANSIAKKGMLAWSAHIIDPLGASTGVNKSVKHGGSGGEVPDGLPRTRMRMDRVGVRGERDHSLLISEYSADGSNSNSSGSSKTDVDIEGIATESILLSTMLGLSNNAVGLDHVVTALHRRFNKAESTAEVSESEHESCANNDDSDGAMQCSASSLLSYNQISAHYSRLLFERQRAVSGADLVRFFTRASFATTVAECGAVASSLPAAEERLVLFCTNNANADVTGTNSVVFRGSREVGQGGRAVTIVASDFGFHRLTGEYLLAQLLRQQSGHDSSDEGVTSPVATANAGPSTSNSDILQDVFSPAGGKLADFVAEILLTCDDEAGAGGGSVDTGSDHCSGLSQEDRGLLKLLLPHGSASAHYDLDSVGALFLEKFRNEVYGSVLTTLFAANDNAELQARQRSASEADLHFEAKPVVAQLVDVVSAGYGGLTAALHRLRDQVLAVRGSIITAVRGKEAADRATAAAYADTGHSDSSATETNDRRVPATTYMLMDFLDQRHHERLSFYSDWYISLLLSEDNSLRSNITGTLLNRNSKRRILFSALKRALTDMLQSLGNDSSVQQRVIEELKQSGASTHTSAGNKAPELEALVSLAQQHWAWKFHHVLRMPASFMTNRYLRDIMTQRVPVAVASAAVSLHRLSTSILATTAVSITGSSDTIFRSEPAARNIITYVVHGKVGRSKKNKANGWLTELTEFMGNPNGEHDSRMSTFGSRINSAYRQILTVGARSNSKDKDNDYACYSTHTVLNKE